MEKAKKSLSQNFLKDNNIVKKIINQAKVKDLVVLEIGPGYGIMTDHILKKKPKKIILIEKDSKIVKFLINKYKNNKTISIIEGDILKYDLSNYKKLVIISNLPYNISTKIIIYLFKFRRNILEIICMMQKEVALKFDYKLPKMNKYKFITRIVSSYNKCFDVSPNVFIPKPKVNSTVVKFVFNQKNKVDLIKANNFCKLIFKNVRKKINNNINLKKKSELLNKRVDELSVNEILKIYNLF